MVLDIFHVFIFDEIAALKAAPFLCYVIFDEYEIGLDLNH